MRNKCKLFLAEMQVVFSATDNCLGRLVIYRQSIINNLSEGYQPGYSPAVLQNTNHTSFNLRQLTTNPALSTINS